MTMQTAKSVLLVSLAAACSGAGCSSGQDTAATGDGTKSPKPSAVRTPKPRSTDAEVGRPTQAPQKAADSDWKAKCEAMVRTQLEARDITNPQVLTAMRAVPRHLFVPERERRDAYGDFPLPIEHGQTISQPYIVALMTQWARPKPQSRALDIGTGSGYQAAVLAELVKEVYSIEIVCPLADSAAKRLQELGYDNVTVKCADGYQGWPEHAPFDLIIVAAAPDHIPQPLIDQLAPGGRLVLPVGTALQTLTVVEKHQDGSVRKFTVTAVRFVPMTGQAEDRRP